MKCKEREKILYPSKSWNQALRRHAFKHKRHTSGRFHYTAGGMLMETVMPRNVTVSVKMYVSSRNAWQFMKTKLIKIGLFWNISQFFMLILGCQKTISLGFENVRCTHSILYRVSLCSCKTKFQFLIIKPQRIYHPDPIDAPLLFTSCYIFAAIL